jgi:hypothetical protein
LIDGVLMDENGLDFKQAEETLYVICAIEYVEGDSGLVRRYVAG